MVDQKIDLHTHSTVSDGTDQPADLVAAAAAAGLAVVALTDHDSVAGWEPALAAGARLGVEVVPGIELSAHVPVPDDDGQSTDERSVHILGYGPDPDNPALRAILERIHQARDQRIPQIVAQLTALGWPLTVAEVEAQAGGAVIGRPHVADALVARGYVADRDEAFARWLRNDGPVQVRRFTPTVGQAVDLIVGAGGVAVLAHPWGRGGETLLTELIIADLVARHQLAGLEADHVDHDPEQQQRLHRLADSLGIMATGSSDYHGRGKTGHPLAARTTEPSVYGELRRRLDAIQQPAG
ncbi:MAG: PHP domain-containing protein [Propionibacteriaceae bacterium]|nr:PHP domain-containing protein [Propionibacteriaceae bacterium]